VRKKCLQADEYFRSVTSQEVEQIDVILKATKSCDNICGSDQTMSDESVAEKSIQSPIMATRRKTR
jgi:hypothetical protein